MMPKAIYDGLPQSTKKLVLNPSANASSLQIPISKAITKVNLPQMANDAYRELSEYFICTDDMEIKKISHVSISILVSLGVLEYDAELFLPGERESQKYKVLKSHILSMSDLKRDLKDNERVEALNGSIRPSGLGSNLFQYIF